MEHHVTVAVDAPPERVWRLFLDVERWPKMTKSIRDVRRMGGGPLEVDSEAIIEQPRLPRARWRVTELEPGRSFTWETTTGGVTTTGGHIVEPNGQGATITLTLRLHGPFAWLAYAFVGHLSRRYLSMEIEGFRRAAEPVRS